LTATVQTWLISIDCEFLDYDDLSKKIRNLIGNTNSYARSLGTSGKPLTDAARNALDLGNLLSDLDTIDTEKSKKLNEINMDLVMESINSLTKPEPVVIVQKKEVTPIKPEIVSEPKTFEEILDKVAVDIENKIVEVGVQNQEGTSLVEELRKLAVAARSGNKSQLIVSGKSCAGFLVSFSNQLKTMADSMPSRNPKEKQRQNNLIRAYQGMKNFSTQLKILTSVKASSIDSDKDTDETLNSITRSIGKLITDGLSEMDIVRKTIIKTK